MPELPEVESLVRALRPRVLGERIERLNILDSKLCAQRLSGINGARIVDLSRLGKQIVFELAGSDKSKRFLVIHLRMTGNLYWFPRRIRGKRAFAQGVGEVRKSSALRARAKFFCRKGVLVFSDLRRFGTLHLTDNLEQLRGKGVDPLSSAFSAKLLKELLAQSKQEIKPWLMRQDRLLGLGNIYAAEILFAAHIDPRRRGNTLSEREVRLLATKTRLVLRAAIICCGTTFSDFRAADGAGGSFQKFLRVYGREGEACYVCKQRLLRIVQQGRSVVFCPGCQG